MTKLISVLLLLLLISPVSHALPRESRVPGGIALVNLGAVTRDVQAPRAWQGEQPVMVLAENGRWVAVVGLALDLQTGSHELRIDDGLTQKSLAITVNAKRYPEQRITLKDTGKVILSPENEARAAKEIDAIQQLKRHWRVMPDNDTDSAFVRPADGRLASRFGLRRYFNGEPRAPHVGLDIAAPRGTPIRAASSGIVLAVDDYFFNGKTVFVDHGNGLITMYCHLDRIDVSAGDVVRKAQPVGLSGATGRASGPHLHWSVVLNGVMVDPELFLGASR